MSPPSPLVRRDALAVLLLLLAVTAGWLAATGRWQAEARQRPLSYSGDGLYYLAMAETSAESGALPFLWKEAPRLNAPRGAEWNDFPIVNELVWSLLGISRRLFGIAGATLWPTLLAHLLAAAAFYLAARWRGGGRPASAVLALVFALSPYILRRGYIHLNLAFAWHLPLAVLVALWAAEEEGLKERKRLLLGIATAVFCGLQATYYALFFLLLLAGAMAAQALAGRRREIVRPALLGVLTVILAAAGNLDSLTYGWAHGENPAAVERSLEEVEVYSLKPVELFLPRGRFAPWLGKTADRLYYSQLSRNAESGSTYLGVVGGVALLLLLAATLAALLQPERRRPPPEAWPAILGFLFAISGGAGTAIAIAGIHVFRAGNRVSILLLAIALLFAARVIGGWRPRTRAAALALIAAVALFDQLPRRDLEFEAFEKTLYEGDARMAAELESAMPGGAIFQLPLADYPEGRPVGPLEPYELLRFYVHSKTLRFSYGAHKGRGDDAWQREILALPWPEAFARLRELGFSAIAVYGRAYPDRGAALVAAIEAAGGGPTFSLPPQAIRVILLPPAAPPLNSSKTTP
jgi:phosphoglycerol transferase